MSGNEPLFEWVGPSETGEWETVWERPCRHNWTEPVVVCAACPLRAADPPACPFPTAHLAPTPEGGLDLPEEEAAGTATGLIRRPA